jgi:hypothetical protein
MDKMKSMLHVSDDMTILHNISQFLLVHLVVVAANSKKHNDMFKYNQDSTSKE